MLSNLLQLIHLEKVACGAFSDIGFVPAAKGATFAACVAPGTDQPGRPPRS
jgi:hypothetical protein